MIVARAQAANRVGRCTAKVEAIVAEIVRGAAILGVMDILKTLSGGDRRSIGEAGLVVELVLKTHALLGDVIRGFTHDDPLIRMRCADVAEKVSVVHPEWLARHKSALLSFAIAVQEKEVRWHMAQMLPRLALSPSERRTAVALLFKYLNDESRIVKTWSMQALFEMSEKDARLRARVVPVLEAAIESGSAAERSRARKLLTAIDRGPAAPARGRGVV
jgi:hypothetical protein